MIDKPERNENNMPAFPIDCEPILFPSDNAYGIPSLLPATAEVILPTCHWRAKTLKSKMVKTWLFYVDDWKFESVWKNPKSVSDGFAIAAGEVNYSLAPGQPLAIVLWKTYQKRWLSRFWQREGMDIFVDLNVPRDFAQINMLGVPQGWRCYCTRAADRDIDELRFQADLAQQHAGGPITLIVSGGGKQVRDLCQHKQWHWVADLRNVVRSEKQLVLSDKPEQNKD